ncbi:MAG: DUF5666 domain-containing protein [Burkholderiaceae bacterium]
MRSTQTLWSAWRRTAAAVATALLGLAALLPGCGGVGSGGTGSFASGPITGYGSIVVGSVHFDESAAEIRAEDGTPLAAAQLALGMVVQVRGGEVVDAQALASQVVAASELVGRVDAVDVATSRLTVNGVVVRTHAGTAFDAAFAGALAGVAVGDTVEVWGLPDSSTGEVSATRVAPRSGVASYQFRGELAALDAKTRRFAIGTQGFDAGALAAWPAGLDNGVTVRVITATARGSTTQRWSVQSLIVVDAPPRDLDEATVNGLISRLRSQTDFNVDGVKVDATTAAIVGGPLALGQRVAVQGRLQGGVLQATQVSVQPERGDDDFEMKGTIAGVDALAKRFSLVGRSELVSYAGPGVKFEDGSEASLQPGRRVKASGVLSADGTRLEATKIEFSD